ncbi:MAG: hypothetical protein J6U47_01215 [Bacteroidales bacterium]|nr:hypothetical protein [Bacteroidales bacterium]
MKKISLLMASLAIIVASCCNNNTNNYPKNVIYLIGDGMGFGAVSSLLLSQDSITGF